MKIISCAVLLAASALAQDKPSTIDLESQFDKARASLDAAKEKLEAQRPVIAEVPQLGLLEMQMDKARMSLDAAQISIGEKGLLAFQGPNPMPFPKVVTLSGFRSDGSYDGGTRALDQHKYEDAIQNFDRVITDKSPRADGAYYWKAYALNRLGRRDDALAAIAALRQNYPSSGWLKDAQALEAEVKQSSGQAASPAQDANEDIKLMAINSLMNADPERAIPLLDGILKSNSPHNVKDRALFVLTQNHSPRAEQLLLDYAKGAGNPDVQSSAIRYMAMSGKDASQSLGAIYSGSSDTRIKREILQSMASARGSGDALLNLAKSEKDASLRTEAIRYASSSRETSVATLAALYGTETDPTAKKAIIDGLYSRRDAKTLIDLAKKESDPAMKKTLVERIGSMKGSPEAIDYMMELLK